MPQFSLDFKVLKSLCEKVAQTAPRGIIHSKKIWIFGAGQFGRDVCSILRQEGFDVAGFIESKPCDSKVSGLPVLTWEQLSADQIDMQLAVGIFNRQMPLDELEGLARSAGFSNVFMPWDLYAQFVKQFGWRFWLSSPRVIVDSLSAIEQVCQNLADEESRRCFLEICAFRLGQHTAYAHFTHPERQYFNELTFAALPEGNISYVDGGAYNGDTFLELSGERQISAAYLFEPDPENFLALTEAVKNAGAAVLCLPIAVSDQYRILSFAAGNGEGGAISEKGTVHIAAAALDQMLPGGQIDFIKLDVEGAEVDALRGAKVLIERSRPVLAISLYHRPEDLWKIPEQLFSICVDYKFYIRQHYCNSFDSVLYAIPDSLQSRNP